MKPDMRPSRGKWRFGWKRDSASAPSDAARRENEPARSVAGPCKIQLPLSVLVIFKVDASPTSRSRDDALDAAADHAALGAGRVVVARSGGLQREQHPRGS